MKWILRRSTYKWTWGAKRLNLTTCNKNKIEIFSKVEFPYYDLLIIKMNYILYSCNLNCKSHSTEKKSYSEKNFNGKISWKSATNNKKKCGYFLGRANRHPQLLLVFLYGTKTYTGPCTFREHWWSWKQVRRYYRCPQTHVNLRELWSCYSDCAKSKRFVVRYFVFGGWELTCMDIKNSWYVDRHHVITQPRITEREIQIDESFWFLPIGTAWP